MDIRDYIKIADAFGSETRNLAELKEGELADRLAAELGWTQDDSEEIEQSVEDTGNDPEEIVQIIEPSADAPEAQTTAPEQPETPGDGPGTGRDGQGVGDGSVNTTAPEQPEQPEAETNPELDAIRQNAGLPPATDSAADDADSADSGTPPEDPDANDPRGDQTNPPAAPQTDAELDADSADSGVDTTDDARAARTNAPQTDAELDADSADNAPQGDSLAGRLDTETPSLLDAYNDGGRQAMDNVRDLQQGLERLGFDPNGVDGKYGRGTYAAVQEFQRQNGLTVDGEAGPTTMAKLQELLNAGSATPQADAAAAAGVADAGDAGQEPNAAAPQTDAELDADSADSGTPTSRLDTKGETPAPQTDAELDADSADAATPAAPRVSDERGVQSNGSIVNFNMDQFKSSGTYVDIPDRNNPGFVTRVYGPRDNLETFIQNDRRGQGLTIQGGTQQAGTPDAERDSRERGVQTASKDFSMKKFIKESKALDECGTMPMSSQQEGSPVSMNVTLNASGEQNVQELIRMMQLAGAQGAAPVADMHAGPMDKHDDMVHMMSMMDEPEEAMPEEAVEEDWDNSPNEDYRDHKHMTKDLSGGLNREKKAYAKAQDGDNAMAVESIKEQLLKALEETGYRK